MENNSESRALKMNLFFQFFYQLLTMLTPIITSPYLSRKLGPVGLGIFSSTYSYACYFILLCKLGVETYGCREIARNNSSERDRNRVFWSIYSIQLLFSFFSCLFYVIFLLVLDSGSNDYTIQILQGLWVLAATLDISWYYWGIEKFKITTIVNTCSKIFTIFATIFFIKNNNDLFKYVIIMGGGLLGCQIIMWIFGLYSGIIRLSKIEFNTNHIKKMIYFFIPVLAMSIFHIMDKTMLGIFSNSVECGYYYNVDRLANISIGVTLGINTVMLPRFSKIYAENTTKENITRFLNRSFELVITTATAISFGLVAIGPVFVPVFFGKEFEHCVILIYVMSAAMIFKSVSGFVSNQVLIPSGNEKYYTDSVIVSAFVNLFLNYFLIRCMNSLGATISTVLAEMLLMILVILSTIKRVEWKAQFIQMAKNFLVGIAMVLIVQGMNTFIKPGISTLVIEFLIGGTVFITMNLLFSVWNKDSIYWDILIMVRSFLKKKKYL